MTPFTHGDRLLPTALRRRGLTFLGLAVGAAVLAAVPGASNAVADGTGGGGSRTVPTDPTPAEAMALAKSSGTNVEIPELTSETQLVEARPDGWLELSGDRQPVRTDINGDWEPIDTTLQLNSDGTWSPKAITLPVKFGAGGSSSLATAGEDTESLSFTWDEGDLPEAVVADNRITYPGIRQDVDLVLTVNASGFSDALVVRTPAAADAIAADPPVFTGSSSGLDLEVTDTGMLVAAPDGQASDEAALVSPPPLAWDSSGGGTGDDRPAPDSIGTGTVHELEPAVVLEPDASQGAEMKVEVAPPPAALNSSETEYPLFLDPQISGRLSAHYMTVHSNGWDYHDNAGELMRVGYCGWAECNPSIQGNARSYFSFSTPGLSKGAGDPLIREATVQVQQVWSASSTPQPVNLRRATPFGAGTNYPGPVGAQLQQISSAAGNGRPNAWLSFSNEAVTDYVQERADDEADALQFALSAPYEDNKYFWKKFNNDAKVSVVFAYPPSITKGTATEVVACPGHPVLSRGSIGLHLDAEIGYGSSGAEYAFWIFRNDAANNGPWDDTTQVRASGWDTDNNPYRFTGLPDGMYAWQGGAGSLTDATDENGTEYPSVKFRSDPSNKPFTVDSVKPGPPSIHSNDYPRDYWGRSENNPGTFEIKVPSDVAGVAYAFNTGVFPSVRDDDCSYTANGLRPASGAAATITPTAAEVVPGVVNTLTVAAFDRAHNVSSRTTYSFYVSPDLDGTTATNRVEIESSTIAKHTFGTATVTGELAPGGSPAPGLGHAVTLTGADGEDRVEVDLQVNEPGYYALGGQFATCPGCGTAQITITGAQTGPPTVVDTDAPTANNAYAPIGGYQLDAGTHKLVVRFPDASAATPAQVGIDYLTFAQLQGGAYGSTGDGSVPARVRLAMNLGEAFNNHGIGTTGDTDLLLDPGAAATDTSPARSSGGFSTTELAGVGIAPGQDFTTTVATDDGPVSTTFRIPSATAKGDNVIAASQRIIMPEGTTADHVDFLVASTCTQTVPSQNSLFALTHQPTDGAPQVTLQQRLSAPVPTWRDGPAAVPAPVSMSAFFTGSPAVAATGNATVYVIEVDVDEENRANPLVEVTLPSTGATMTATCSGGAARLHVLAMTTRND